MMEPEYECKHTKDDLECYEWICQNLEERKEFINWEDHNTIKKAFGLICDKYEWGVVIESMLYIGALFGYFLFPYIADNYGRKYTLINFILWIICFF